MNERMIKSLEVQKEMAENVRLIKQWKLNSIMCENMIKTTEKLLRNEERLYNDRVEKLNKQSARALENAKISHKNLEKLLKEKEALHLKLKEATHIGEVLCEFCKKYYTPQGLSRHKAACAMKPSIKIVKKHEKEIKDDKKDLAARKAALKKELAALEK